MKLLKIIYHFFNGNQVIWDQECVFTFMQELPPPKKALKLAIKLKSLGKLTDVYTHTHTHTHTPISSFYSKDTPFQLS